MLYSPLLHRRRPWRPSGGSCHVRPGNNLLGQRLGHQPRERRGLGRSRRARVRLGVVVGSRRAACLDADDGHVARREARIEDGYERRALAALGEVEQPVEEYERL